MTIAYRSSNTRKCSLRIDPINITCADWYVLEGTGRNVISLSMVNPRESIAVRHVNKCESRRVPYRHIRAIKIVAKLVLSKHQGAKLAATGI